VTRTYGNQKLKKYFTILKQHLLQWCVTSKGDRRKTYRILVGTAEGKRQRGIPSCRREIILKWLFKKQNSGVD
jgi:hypothetical protein